MKISQRFLSILLLPALLIFSACQKGGGVPVRLEAQDGSRYLANGSEPQELLVKVLNSYDKPVSGIKVTFESQDEAVSFPNEAVSVSDENGSAKTAVTVSPRPGTHHVRAHFRLPDGTTKETTFALNWGVSVAGDHQQAMQGLSVKEPVALTFFNEDGSPKEGVPVHFFCEGASPKVEFSAENIKSDPLGLAKVYIKGAKQSGKSFIHAEAPSYDCFSFSVQTIDKGALILKLCGFFSLFYLGLVFMSFGLRTAASEKLKALFNSIKRRPLQDLFKAAFVTAILQSSGAASDMVVGFVNAGLLALSVSVPLILGCNIGSTIAPQIMACRLFPLIMPALILGAIFRLIPGRRGDFWHALSRIFFGFGTIFLAFYLLEETLTPLAGSEYFSEIGKIFDCSSGSSLPFLYSFLAAFAVSALLRSSAATVGAVIILACSGMMNFATICPLILGCNLGKSIAVHLSAKGTSRAAHRVAVIHTIINLFTVALGTACFFIKFNGRSLALIFFDAFCPGDAFAGEEIGRHVAMAHTMINVMTALLLLPFSSLLVKIAERIIPVKAMENEKSYVLDSRLLLTPNLAFAQLRRLTVESLEKGQIMMRYAYTAFMENDFSKDMEIITMENELDDFQRDVSSFLTWLSEYNVDKQNTERVPAYIHVAHDIERIGDIAVNFLHMAKNCAERDLLAHKESVKPIDDYFSAMDLYCSEILRALKGRNEEREDITATLIIRQKVLQQLDSEIQSEYSAGGQSDMRSIKIAVLINDSVTIMSRMTRHLLNIAQRITLLTKD
ncbi:Na/Pi symporter [bacterium]|nr:Na/Pi symporter [bacterium]